jgi:sec-independent protein translocase protein TatC
MANYDLQEISSEEIERDDLPMDYIGHLDELRSRLIVVLVIIFLFFAGGMFIRSIIINALLEPLQRYGPELSLKYDYMGESILVQLKASFIAAIGLTIPVALFQIWSYIKPAIDKQHRMLIRIVLIFSVILFYTGAYFSYSFIAPATIQLIEQFSHKEIPNIINVTNYLHFLVTVIVILGILFELPVVIVLLTKLEIVTPKILNRYRPYAIVLIFILAAIITPPDILTQLMIAFPLILLFEISLILAWLVYKFSVKKNRTITIKQK